MDAMLPAPYTRGSILCRQCGHQEVVLLCSSAKFHLGHSSAELQRGGNGDGWCVALGAEQLMLTLESAGYRVGLSAYVLFQFY